MPKPDESRLHGLGLVGHEHRSHSSRDEDEEIGEILEDEHIEDTDDLNELIEAKSIITDEERMGPISVKRIMPQSPLSQSRGQ